MPTPIQDLKPEDRIFALLVGDSGSGKTCTLPYFPGKKLDLDLDKRWKGILGHKTAPKTNIDVHQFKGKDILKEIEDLFNQYEGQMSRGVPFPYSTLMFDGFTAFDQLVCDDAIELVGKNTGGDFKNAGNKKFGELDLMGWDAFAYELQAFKNIMTALKYIFPCNVLCTAHWTDRYVEGKVVGRDINLRKKIINQVILWFDEVWFFEKETSKFLDSKGNPKMETKHYVSFRNDLARTTFVNLPDRVDWTNKDFYQLLMSGIAGGLKDA